VKLNAKLITVREYANKHGTFYSLIYKSKHLNN